MSLSIRLRYFALGSLATVSAIALGVAPQLEANLVPFSWEQQAIAQEFTQGELRDYAEAYLAIYGGNRMQDLLMEIEALTGEKTSWEVRCDNANSIRKLGNREAISKVQNYCNEELPALIDEIITRSTFNSISNQLENDEALRSTIFDLMTEILNNR
ncbi:hypothetical protein Lepto7376_2002 [[Leptolyngbya] sp. PCC 7376]|uniref:DUF4168 domain-containing protein n=1 Tax=[Leptolyngbya] sp. PCC 7376 TaxID=111781 RepID=UPI00029F3887|nr:DUF4168 domain-containing protein [[Leptolyngbya] sp. PCC 7376]AFY38312.1 hypothetical protein Lepto7376_2002 [[Leptolyngbya] sp. PCC 7376]